MDSLSKAAGQCDTSTRNYRVNSPERLTEEPLQSFRAGTEDAGKRLDQYLTAALENVSRARVQELIEQEKVRVDGATARRSSKLRGNELIEITGPAQRAPLKASSEDIPLDVVYEDEYLAVINKPAGMIVHAGAGDEDRNRGTLVNALLFHFRELSGVGGESRPGIVHRLDKDTSGLIVVAKMDEIHRKLAAQFASRQVKKKYIALVMGWAPDKGSIDAEISRDRLRPTRMTTRRSGGRSAVSHFQTTRKIESRFGKFALVDVTIETGRTHQIRVHLASLHHPVVGDTLYGAPAILRANAPSRTKKEWSEGEQLTLNRNFLHAARLEFIHPATRKAMQFESELPKELQKFLTQLEFVEPRGK